MNYTNMKNKILIVLFIAQIVTFCIGLAMMIMICTHIPNTESLKPFCIGTFLAGTILFVFTQALFSFLKKNK